LGIDISYEEVLAKAGDGSVGRPHFAAVLVEKNYVRSVQEAFDKYLAAGAPAYVDKKRLAPAEAIALIQGTGGLAVLAHPIRLKMADRAELDALVAAGGFAYDSNVVGRVEQLAQAIPEDGMVVGDDDADICFAPIHGRAGGR